MASCICCPGIDADIDRAEALGVPILGCCGDKNHTSGFHVPAARLPARDYSRVRSGKPVKNRLWACAGDFGRVSWTADWLAWLVNECRAGRKPMIVEIIGSLDGQRALYWAAWNNWKAKWYTGQGHKTWTHVAADRAKANLDPRMFVNWGPDVRPPAIPAIGRTFRLTDPLMTGEDIRHWQGQMLHLYRLGVDGVYGPESERVCREFQRVRGLAVDGEAGPITQGCAYR